MRDTISVTSDGEPSFRGLDVSIPRFDDVLEAFPNTRLNVDTKCRKVAEPLAEIVRRHRAHDRVLIAAEEEGAPDGSAGLHGAVGSVP